MIAALFRLLAIAAMLLMPAGVGMASAATAVGQSAAAERVDDGHCGGDMDHESGKVQPSTHCSAACTALPAQPGAAVPMPQLTQAPAPSLTITGFAGITLPPATPPPRLG